ncbi:MAG TPA: aminoglycoside phosphotransferase family protein [Acidimicrobiales bacterium]|nr:aminoglycoside phosphotransferase family protein [Acidimicrobiales bacterium]
MNLAVPDAVANAARAYGAGRWLGEIAGLIAELEAEWAISVGRPYPHSSEAFVAQASLADGTPAVLKLLIPREAATGRHEITMLRLTGGQGCVGLLRDDAARRALLLERLGPSLFELGRPLAERLEILVRAAAAVWRPAAGCGLPTGADRARQLVDFVTTEWEELGHPCSEAAVEDALDSAARRMAAHDDERAVLVHGDVHQLNALQVPGGDMFKLVDPNGLVAEAECEAGVMMRNDPVELLEGDPWARAHWLAGRCGLDAKAIWEWGVVERVASGLLCTRINLQPLGRHMLEAADRLAVL